MPPMGAVGATINVERLVALAAASARWRRPLQGPAGLTKLSQVSISECVDAHGYAWVGEWMDGSVEGLVGGRGAGSWCPSGLLYR